MLVAVGRFEEDELRTALRNASAETDRLVQLAGDLLLIARSDRGQLPLRLEPVGVCELLESVRERFAWRAAEEEFAWPDEPGERVRAILRRTVAALGIRASVDVSETDDAREFCRPGRCAGPIHLDPRRICWAAPGVSLV